MDIRRHIPNLLTLLNLFSGCVALIYALEKQFGMALFFVALGIFFDFFDGFFARMFKVSGPLGVQLDSLADMVTSGVVPGLTMYFMMSNSLFDEAEGEVIKLFPFLGFIITLGACYRLAKFNIDERQSDSFIGLPTPANALFIVSLPLVRTDAPLIVLELLTSPYTLTVITLFSAWIMNAEIPLFSLKIKTFSFATYSLQFIFLGMSALLLLFLQVSGIPLIIILYVLLSLARNRMVIDVKAPR